MQKKYNKLLEERGLKTAYVARQTGIPYNTLNDWRKGRTKKISAENLEKLSQFFGLPSEYFTESTNVEHLQIENEKRIRHYATVLSALSNSDREMIEELIERMNHGKGED